MKYLKLFLNWLLCKEPTVYTDGVTVKKPRKKNDCTPFTQYHYDFICRTREDWVQYNKDHPGMRISLAELTHMINSALHLDKSQRALARIWSGDVNREDLPAGKPVTDN